MGFGKPTGCGIPNVLHRAWQLLLAPKPHRRRPAHKISSGSRQRDNYYARDGPIVFGDLVRAPSRRSALTSAILVASLCAATLLTTRERLHPVVCLCEPNEPEHLVN